MNGRTAKLLRRAIGSENYPPAKHEWKTLSERQKAEIRQGMKQSIKETKRER